MPLSDRDRKCDLGSPVRETCTPGSAWGDGYKGHAGSVMPRSRKGPSGKAPQRLPLQGLSLPATPSRTRSCCSASLDAWSMA